jgi:putative ABC transport system substrate-binding protein
MVCAQEIVVVQSLKVKPFDDAVHGFKSHCSAPTTTILLGEPEETELLRSVRARKPVLILAVGAEALSRVSKITDIPVIYLMVANPPPQPMEAKNITGVSMNPAPAKELTLLRQALPGARRIGLLYDPRRTGPLVERLRGSARALGFELQTREVQSAKEVPEQLQRLKSTIDAFLMVPDPTVLTPETVEHLFLFSQERRLPVISFSQKYLKMGALLSLDIDSYDMGGQAGEMANRILAGSPVPDIPPVFARQVRVNINQNVAKHLGLSLTERQFSPSLPAKE